MHHSLVAAAILGLNIEKQGTCGIKIKKIETNPSGMGGLKLRSVTTI